MNNSLETPANKPKDDPWLSVLGQLRRYIETNPNARLTLDTAQGYEFIWKALELGNQSIWKSRAEYFQLTGKTISRQLLTQKRDRLIRLLE